MREKKSNSTKSDGGEKKAAQPKGAGGRVDSKVVVRFGHEDEREPWRFEKSTPERIQEIARLFVPRGDEKRAHALGELLATIAYDDDPEGRNTSIRWALMEAWSRIHKPSDEVTLIYASDIPYLRPE